MYKVFLADDEIVVREGIRNSIPWEQSSFCLTGEAPDGEIALAMILELRPDILITDIRMPFMDGLALSRLVKKSLPSVKIIILSGHDEFEYAREAISIGVEEYLLKPVSAEDMIKALDKVAQQLNKGKDHTRSGQEGVFDPAALLDFDSEILFTKLKFAHKKDIDSIVREYSAILEKSPGENPMLSHFIFGEILVAATKAAESIGGNINEIVPFSLDNSIIRDITGSPAVFSQNVTSLLCALVEFRDSRAGGRYQSVIVKAREYIGANFADSSLSLNSTAAHVGISPSYLSAVFARETGENFIDYLTRLRIERAKLLLRNTSMKNTDIADETGFKDPHYFSAIFKKITGISPRKFRTAE